MSHEVGMFELLLTGGGAGGTAIAGWIHMRVNSAALKIKVEYLEKQIEELKENSRDNMKDINGKLDSIFKLLGDLKVSIATKKK